MRIEVQCAPFTFLFNLVIEIVVENGAVDILDNELSYLWYASDVLPNKDQSKLLILPNHLS